MTYRDDLAALDARQSALATEVAAKAKELVHTTQMLDEARARIREPLLPNIRVAAPCSADWAAMTGDDKVRACADCKKNVYNLSGMTRDEAEAVIIEHEGKLCVRYFQRADGTILLKDCAVGLSKRRRRRWVAAGAAMLLAGTGGGAALAHGQQTQGAVQYIPSQAVRVDVIPSVEIPGAKPFEPAVDPVPPPPTVPLPPDYHELKGQMIMGVVAPPPPPLKPHGKKR